jgi:transposase
MSKYQFTDEQYEEIISSIKTITAKTPLRKLQVLQLRMEGYKDSEIAKITKYSAGRVSAICCDYAKNGISEFLQENRVGGNRRNITVDEEREILRKFKDLAAVKYIVF